MIGKFSNLVLLSVLASSVALAQDGNYPMYARDLAGRIRT
jgi:hypothetical protein